MWVKTHVRRHDDVTGGISGTDLLAEEVTGQEIATIQLKLAFVTLASVLNDLL